MEVTEDQSICLISEVNWFLFLTEKERPDLKTSFCTATVLNCIWNTGKWSLISHKRMPLMLLLMSLGDIKMLSIRVAEVEVILVGLVMTGKSE